MQIKMKRTLKYILVLLLATGISASVNGQTEELSLDRAIIKAMENNYGIRISDADSDIASINNSWGNAGALPTIGFTASSLNSAGVINNSTTTSRLTSGVALRWTIFDGFRVTLTKDKLGMLEDLSAGKGAITVENTLEAVILAYYDVLLQKERLKVVETVMNLSKDRYDYELIRQEIGKSLTYNVLLAKNSYLTDRASFLNQEVTLRNAVRNLNYILGEEAGASWIFTEPFTPVTDLYILSDLREKMVSDNRSLRNQYINLLLSKNETEIRKGDFLPALSLTGGADNSNTLYGTNSGFSNGTVTGYANISFTYDIYQAGSRKRALEIARINEEIADIQIDQMIHSLTNQLFSVYDLYNVRRELFDLAGESLEAAQLNMEIAEDKYKSGAINSFNYRDIQLIYLNSALQKLQATYNLIGSNSALTRLTGGFVNSGE